MMFLLGHVLGKNIVSRFSGSLINRVNQRLSKSGLMAVITFRIIPVAPFSLINLVAGVSAISLRDFFIGTIIGIIPGIIAISFVADRLFESLRQPDISTFAALFAVVVVFGITLVGFRKWIKQRYLSKQQAKRLLMGLRIATYNIHQCVGRDGVENPRRIAAVLNEINADIVALQEVTSHPEISDDMLAYLAAATDMNPVEGFTLSIAGSRYGNALLSSVPISAVNRVDISVQGREPRGVIEVVVKHSCQTIALWATHLGLGIQERHQQLNKLLKIVNAAEADMSILLGDLNEWFPWGRPLRALQRRFATADSPATFPAGRPFLKLDRILVRPADRIATIRTHSSKLSRVASDHLPLVADLALCNDCRRCSR